MRIGLMPGSKPRPPASLLSIQFQAEPYILTPKPPEYPRINSAAVFGVRPGSPFLFRVLATGSRPVTFFCKGLPAGLAIDPQTGIITGKLQKAGTYAVTLCAKNAKGTSEKKFRIICGDRIALMPPMGWNSWNCFAGEVSAEKVKKAAAAMVNSGLVDHGWTYINIDDFWQHHPRFKRSIATGQFPRCRWPYHTQCAFQRYEKDWPDDMHSDGIEDGYLFQSGTLDLRRLCRQLWF